MQKNILGGFGLGSTASLQLNFKRGDGQPVRTATLKTKGTEPEQLPLFSSKDTISVEVGHFQSAVTYLFRKLSRCLKDLQLRHHVGLAQNNHTLLSCTCIIASMAGILMQSVNDRLLLCVCAQVKVANLPGKKLDHLGIKVQLLGQIEVAAERGHPQDFLGLGMATNP